MLENHLYVHTPSCVSINTRFNIMYIRLIDYSNNNTPCVYDGAKIDTVEFKCQFLFSGKD